MRNAKTYMEQVFKILSQAKTEIRFNSEWFDKMRRRRLDPAGRQVHAFRRCSSGKTFTSVFRKKNLSPCTNCSIRWRRDTIRSRCKQTSNLAAPTRNSICWSGARLQRAYGQESQVVLTMPILEGLDGVQKMSKSLRQRDRDSRAAAGNVRQSDVDFGRR